VIFNMKLKNKVIALLGPTSVGKTQTSLILARLTNSEIISCDSMQVYKGMDIGTAKVSAKEALGIPHHLIDIKESYENYSVCDYVSDDKKALCDIFSRGKNVLVVGGTGLYADSFIKDSGFSKASPNEEIRKELNEIAKAKGNEALHKILEEIDIESAKSIHANNVKRVIRAIEYFRLSGEKLSEHKINDAQNKSPYDYVYIGLTRDRDELYERIDQRVDQMIEMGLVDEVKKLWQNGCNLKNTSMQALGYKEIIHYIEGRCTLNEAIRILKRDTRRYAKRQLTWLRRNSEINWINLTDIKTPEEAASAALNIIEKQFK